MLLLWKRSLLFDEKENLLIFAILASHEWSDCHEGSVGCLQTHVGLGRQPAEVIHTVLVKRG